MNYTENSATFKVVHLVCGKKKGIAKYVGLYELKVIHWMVANQIKPLCQICFVFVSCYKVSPVPFIPSSAKYVARLHSNWIVFLRIRETNWTCTVSVIEINLNAYERYGQNAVYTILSRFVRIFLGDEVWPRVDASKHLLFLWFDILDLCSCGRGQPSDLPASALTYP